MYGMNQPALQAVAYVPIIMDAQRMQMEQQNQMNYPGYGIMDFTDSSQTAVMMAPMRSQYWPIYYIYPSMGNSMLVGLDLSQVSAYSWVLQAAMMSMMPMASPRVTMMEASTGNPYNGVYIAAPIMNGTQVLGFVVGAVNVQVLANNIAFTNQMMMSFMVGNNVDFELFFQYPTGGKYSFLYSYDHNQGQLFPGQMGGMPAMPMGMSLATMNMNMGTTSPPGTQTNMQTTMMPTMTPTMTSMPTSMPSSMPSNMPTMMTTPGWTPVSPQDVQGHAIQNSNPVMFGNNTWVMVDHTDEAFPLDWVPWTVLGIILFLTLALEAYLVFSLWGYRAAFQHVKNDGGNGFRASSQGTVPLPAVHYNGDD